MQAIDILYGQTRDNVKPVEKEVPESREPLAKIVDPALDKTLVYEISKIAIREAPVSGSHGFYMDENKVTVEPYLIYRAAGWGNHGKQYPDSWILVPPGQTVKNPEQYDFQFENCQVFTLENEPPYVIETQEDLLNRALEAAAHWSKEWVRDPHGSYGPAEYVNQRYADALRDYKQEQ